ncbi:hypothetical protein GCM10020358_31820 [Amorphoplanes nipponensis]
MRAPPVRIPEKGPRQPVVQEEPFSAYAVGAPLLPVWVAWNPKLTDAPGARLAL